MGGSSWRTRGHQTLKRIGAFLFWVSMHDKFADFKPRFHFPCVLRVIALCSVHCFTGIILGHRCCLLGTVDKSKTKRLALGSSLSLQPLVHPRNSLTRMKSPLPQVPAGGW